MTSFLRSHGRKRGGHDGVCMYSIISSSITIKLDLVSIFEIRGIWLQTTTRHLQAIVDND